jgi:tRNA G18 (ribose-2'-O)-methylase SpoU
MRQLEFQSERPVANVVPEYRDLPASELKARLQQRRSPLINVCMNLTSDFNKAQIIRAANAFLAGETWLIGPRKLDTRGAVGMQYLETIREFDDFATTKALLGARGYTVYAVDNVAEFKPVSIYGFDLPEKTAFVFGEERRGIAPEVAAQCDGAVFIPQAGAVMSLNVAQAAAICMSEYARKYTII